MATMYAIRYDNHDYAIGDVLPASHVWDDGTMTSEVLPGTCGILTDYDPVYDDAEPDWVQIARKHDIYGCAHAYVITGSAYDIQYGQDPGEVIVPDASVYRRLW